VNHRVRRIAPNRTISTVAGTGRCASSGDRGPAASAQLCLPAQTLLDSAGNLYVADYGNSRVRRIASDGTIATVAGSGQPDTQIPPANGDGGPALNANLFFVGSAAFGPSGNLYVSDETACQIRKIAPDGTISTIAGTGKCGVTGDGSLALQAMLQRPGPLSVDSHETIYFITGDSRIHKITPDGMLTLVAGTGTGTGLIRSQGDGGPAVQATLNEPNGVAIDAQGNIYVADTSNARLRKIDTKGIISTVAGPAPQLGVDYYNGVAVDPQGNVYFGTSHADPAKGISSVVNRLNPDGSVTPVAGNGQICVNSANGEFPSDGAPATQARLCAVISMTIDSQGIMYLSEGVYAAVLRVSLPGFGGDGTIQRVAGSSMAFFPNFGDGGPALRASLKGQGWSPGAAAFDPSGNMFLSQTGTSRIREMTTTPYSLKVSPDHLDAASFPAQTATITTSANFAEPFPYAVRVRTEDGGSWLSVNRVTGLVGEPIVVRLNPTALPYGSNRGTVSVVLATGTPGGIAQQVDVPVSIDRPFLGIQ